MEISIINVITNVIYFSWKPYSVKVIREGYLVSPQNPLPWVNVTFMPPAVPSFSLQFAQLTKLSIMSNGYNIRDGDDNWDCEGIMGEECCWNFLSCKWAFHTVEDIHCPRNCRNKETPNCLNFWTFFLYDPAPIPPCLYFFLDKCPSTPFQDDELHVLAFFYIKISFN